MESVLVSLNSGRSWSISNNIFGHATSSSVVRRRLSLTTTANLRWLLIVLLPRRARRID
jgi:hypothetical protein